jgi:nitrogen regulatory protein P-II 1
MKRVTAIIKPFKLETVQETLRELDVRGMTVTEVRGFGRQGGQAEVYRGAEYRIEFVAKLRLDLVVEDQNVLAVVDAITEAAGTGRIGDGKIWVTEAERIVRIRTGDEGIDAII